MIEGLASLAIVVVACFIILDSVVLFGVTDDGELYVSRGYFEWTHRISRWIKRRVIK